MLPITKKFLKYFLFSATKLFFISSLFLFSIPAFAENINEALTNTTIDTRTVFEKLMSSRPSVGPSSSVTTPVAYGVGWGTLLFGVAGQNGTQYTHRPFGEYAAGFGLGDPNRYASLTTIITMGGLDEVVRDGNVNFQLSRHLNSLNGAIAVGLENAAPWGADKRNKMNVYAVGSRCTTLHFTADAHINIITSLGVGNSRFVHNYETHQDETGIFRPFASIGVQVLPQAAVILDYVGLTYNAGISIVPFLKYPLVASLTAVDFTGRGGSHVPIAGSLGYSYTF
jgi:hypothetical protein